MVFARNAKRHSIPSTLNNFFLHHTKGWYRLSIDTCFLLQPSDIENVGISLVQGVGSIADNITMRKKAEME